MTNDEARDLVAKALAAGLPLTSMMDSFDALVADGISDDKAAELTLQFVNGYRRGDINRDPAWMARHFVELRHAAQGKP